MINAENSELGDKATRITRNLGMLLLLRRPLRNAVTFCAFENLPSPAEALSSSSQKICIQRQIC
jgi:hypothetical protein